MNRLQLQQQRDYLMDIACDLVYLIATCKYAEFNRNRVKALKQLKAQIKSIDEQLG